MSSSGITRKWAGPEEWVRHRPIIETLYIGEARSLNEVSAILARDYHFHATSVSSAYGCDKAKEFHRPKMYKSRLTQWKIRKNYTAREKHAVATKMEHYRRQRLPLPDLELHGRPVKLDRIRRFCRQRRIFSKSCLSSPNYQGPLPRPIMPPNEKPGLSNVISVMERTQISFPLCQGPTHVSSTESATMRVLFELRRYFNSDPFPGSNGSIQQGVLYLERRCVAHDFGTKLLDGFRFLVAGKFVEACKNFNDGCAVANKVIREQPRSIFDIFFTVFLDASWASHARFRQHLLTFIRNLAVIALTPSHPLPTILGIILRYDIMPGSVSPLFQQMIDASQDCSNHSKVAVNQMKRNLINLLRAKGDYIPAENLIRQDLLANATVTADSQARKHTIWLHLLLGRIRFDQARYDEARVLYEGVLDRNVLRGLDPHVIEESSIYASIHLGVLDFLHSRIGRAELRIRQALGAALNQYSPDELDTLANFEWLDMVVRAKGHSHLVVKRIADPYQWSGIEWNY